MAANVITITDTEEWKIIEAFLANCGQGAIVLGPLATAEFQHRYGEAPEEQRVEYDYGGDCDVWVDYTNDKGLQHLGINAIVQAQTITTTLHNEADNAG